MSSCASALRRGMAMFDLDRYAEAENFFREALGSDPDHPLALYLLANSIYLQEDRGEEALAVIDNLLAKEPGDSSNHLLRARILDGLDRDKEGLVAVDQALALDPESANALAVRASLLLDLNRRPEAEACARRALELEPDHTHAGLMLSAALRMQGKRAEDRDRARELLAREPNSSHAHTNAGYAALSSGRYPEAEDHFLESLRLDPLHRDAQEGLKMAFRARSRVYAAELRFSHWFAAREGVGRYVLLILVCFALGAGSGFVRDLAGDLVARVFSLASLTFFALWITHTHLGNLALMADARGRHALDSAERWTSLVVVTLLPVGLLLRGLAMAHPPLLTPLGTHLVWAAIALGMSRPNAVPAGRVFFLVCGLLLLAGWTASVLSLGLLRGVIPPVVPAMYILHAPKFFAMVMLLSVMDRFRR